MPKYTMLYGIREFITKLLKPIQWPRLHLIEVWVAPIRGSLEICVKDPKLDQIDYLGYIH
jgi:hypothetical protein